MLVSEGYSADDIAAKLTSIGIRFTRDGGTFTIVDDAPAKGSSDPVPGQSADKNETLTILGCLSDIVENTCERINPCDSKFNSKVYSTCREQIQYVCDMVGITPKQVVLLASIIENKGRRNFDKHDLANALGMSYIKLLSFEDDIKALSEKRLVNLVSEEGICVARKTIPALAANEPYSIPVVTGLNTAGLLKEMNEIISSRENDEVDYDTMVKDLDALFENNPEADIVKQARAAGFTVKEAGEDDRVLFYILVKRYIYNDDDEVCWSDYDNILDDESEVGYFCAKFGNERFLLQQKRIVEPVNEEGMANPGAFHIRDEVKAMLFAEVGGVRSRSRRTSLKVTAPDGITAKELYYNDSEGEQIRRLSSLLTQENYNATCERLRRSGMRTGFTCIFYGGPGTGKTESVYQIARATGRGIVAVNVSEIKSCWVGESEKLVKGLFDKYRSIVEESEVAPILLFNEADAIFGIRQEGAERAVDKMENSLQNIILQEMEKLDGILIATTNLTQNLDKAFERRFLYKIRFNKPGLEARTKIWRYMIPDLSESEAKELAGDFDFSGGQIENISRKKMIKSILDGVEPDFREVRSYCGEELIDGKGGEGRKIGF